MIFGKLFGSEKVLSAALEKIHHANLTREERSGWIAGLMQTYEPFKIAQRFIALLVVIPYVLVWLLCVLLYAKTGIFGGDLYTTRELVESIAKLNNETLGTPATVILLFYFSGGAVEGIIGKLSENKRSDKAVE